MIFYDFDSKQNGLKNTFRMTKKPAVIPNLVRNHQIEVDKQCPCCSGGLAEALLSRSGNRKERIPGVKFVHKPEFCPDNEKFQCFAFLNP